MKRSIYIFSIFIKIFFRDRFNLFMIFFFNVFLMVLFGMTMQDKYNIDLNFGFLDFRNDNISLQAKTYLQNQPNVTLKIFSNENEVFNEVKNGNLLAGIIFNPIENIDSLKINIIADPSRKMWLKFLEPMLKLGVVGVKTLNKIHLQTQYVKSNNLKYFDFLFPGLLVFSIMQIGLSGAIMLLTQRENESLKRLQITPLKKWEFLFGYSLAYFTIMMVLTFGYILIAKLLFKYTFVGNLFNITFLIIFSSAFFIVMGILLSNYANKVESGNNFNRFFTFPASFLCGIFIPVETFPVFLQKVALIHPLTYIAKIMRGVTNYNTSLREYSFTLTIFLIIFILMLFISIYAFKWQEKK